MPRATFWLFCFNNFNVYTIEFCIVFSAILGLIIINFSRELIPWYANCLEEKRFYISFNILFLIMIVIFLSPILYLRFKGYINNIYNRIGFYFASFNIAISLLGYCDTIISGILSLLKLKNYVFKGKGISSEDYGNTLILISILVVIWIFLILLNISELLRISLKINTSYNTYLNAISLEKQLSETTTAVDLDEKQTKKEAKNNNKKKKKPESGPHPPNTESNFQMNVNEIIEEIKETNSNPVDKNLVK